MCAKTKLFVLVALIVVISGNAFGQGSGPEDVARRYSDALKIKDWAGAAALMHPDALSRLKRLMLPLVTKRPVDLGNRIFKIRETAEFEALSEPEVFERLMVSLSGNSASVMPILVSAETTPIGQIKEGPDVVHVVLRVRSPGKTIVSSDVAVRTVRRHRREWRLMLPGNLEGLISWWTDASRPSLEDLDKLEIVN
jgi:hypothetical protein